MSKNYFYIMISLLLTGCMGTWISGKTSYLSNDYPDIRAVPEKKEAKEPRGQHERDEKLSRMIDFEILENEREQIKARDETLRKEVFRNFKPSPSSQ